ncbi:MAG: 3-deoxy-manno-octulosonate cytidylyltransferase, partial [Alphaproteobacteria bacterium]|nr:3-deoxy-manno-octulosonate cytidylyltransferase [Alphaproteobacteria bacterium]
MRTLIVIPARYGSTRLPGKPLAVIAGQTMLQRVVNIAQKVQKDVSNHVSVVVATDDERIMAHAKELEVEAVMTPADCATGTDRVNAAIDELKETPDFVVNLQGDAPLTPPSFVSALIEAYHKDSSVPLVTPVVQLSWEALETLRENKKTTPFSGTCAVFDRNTGLAFWFSKNIIPVMRKKPDTALSPVWRHIGMYGYSIDLLRKFSSLPEGVYEKLEGLEQLRVIENGFKVRCVPV